MPDEQHLLTAYRKAGDLQLLGKLYEPYMPLVFGVCLKYYKDEARSEDAVMQIFESLIKKLRVHEVTNFKSWLYTLARNHCLMDLRKTNQVTLVDIAEQGVENEFFLHQEHEDGQIPEERFRLMETCLETLSDEQRRCVTLFYLEQKCYKDVAELTGYELGQVKSYIQNGKRNLKICMEKKEHEQ